MNCEGVVVKILEVNIFLLIEISPSAAYTVVTVTTVVALTTYGGDIDDDGKRKRGENGSLKTHAAY